MPTRLLSIASVGRLEKPPQCLARALGGKSLLARDWLLGSGAFNQPICHCDLTILCGFRAVRASSTILLGALAALNGRSRCSASLSLAEKQLRIGAPAGQRLAAVEQAGHRIVKIRSRQSEIVEVRWCSKMLRRFALTDAARSAVGENLHQRVSAFARRYNLAMSSTGIQ